MTKELGEALDLLKAWKRTKADLQEHAFIRHPFEVSLIDMDVHTWLDKIRKSLLEESYQPSSMLVCDVPKAKYAIRPGSILTMKDRLIYTACLGLCLPAIHRTLNWSQGSYDFGHLLANTPLELEWLCKPFTGWNRFRDSSIAAIGENTKFVVHADIAGFYENIDIGFLISDLKEIGANPEAVRQISKLLNRWAQIQNRGLPQSCSASHLLAKLYLNNVDRALQYKGIIHKRYVDDFRIFATNLDDAKRALVELTVLLRKRGLNLNSSKSQILNAADTLAEIDKVESIISPIRGTYISEAVKGLLSPYISFHDAEIKLATTANDMPLNNIKELYRQHVLESNYFDKTIFNFLINRLGTYKDPYAIKHCTEQLQLRPELTKNILRYIGKLGAYSRIEPEMIRLLEPEKYVYAFQAYELIEWLLSEPTPPSAETIACIRHLTFEAITPPFLRSVCRAFISTFGTSSDLENLMCEYDAANSELEKAEIICCLKRVESGKRNSFIARVEKDCDLTLRAARMTRSK